MFSKVKSAAVFGLETFMVDVEADVKKHSEIPQFNIVGLPDTAVKESRDRVRSALTNSGFQLQMNKTVVNLAPADIKKEGAVYDLPMFIAILKAVGVLTADTDGMALFGELSLDGSVRPVKGMLPMAICAKEHGINAIFVPYDNAAECSIVDGLTVYPVSHAGDVFSHLAGSKQIVPCKPISFDEIEYTNIEDFSDVMGQQTAKKAMEIAAAGGHNVLLIGPPGSGKSMLAKRMPGILPRLSFQEAMETTKIYSIAGLLSEKQPIIKERPFRAPHHSVSRAGLTGGGTVPRPGEISLSHRGVLFLDELPEFDRTAMETLRQPLEDGKVTISRALGSLSYPCNVTLIAAMNPCPCGYYGHPTKKCICSESAVKKYLGKISGPLLDRIDLHVEVPALDFESLRGRQKGETSEEIRARVIKAREIQEKRFKGTDITCNAEMTPKLLREFCPLSESAEQLLRTAFDRLGMSGRAYDRILKVARTVADLNGCDDIDENHLLEALQFRATDKKYF